jgi:UDP-N-acetylmuramyl pentapeptide phosphotransferase/UDP-N-acetylglucosamine-1-phosphate transferase
MQSGHPGEGCGTRVVEQKKLTKGKAALLLVLSALGAIVSATELHGWHVYVGFAIVGIGLLLGFLIWNRES